MVEELDRLREALQFDSGSVTAPKVLSPPSSDASRQESIRSQKVARRREQLESAQREGVEGLVALEEEILKAGDTPELFRELFLAYWSMGAWDRMVELVTKMPRSLAETQTIQEQLALALNRLGRPGDAENVLLKLLERHGPSSETYGILGRVYKDRWEKSSIQGNQLEAQLLLDKAIDAYRRGLEVDWRDAYLGINAVTLMELKDPPDPHRERLFPVVTYAAERKASTGKPDYWDHAMVLELAVLARDEQRARAAFKAILPLTPAPWELETTARNLRSIREARARRGEHLPWADEIEAACDQMAAEGKKPDGALVIKWAREHKAQNAWDMGTKNWERCLYDLGYPEGKLHRLEFNNDGTLKYQ